MCKVIITRLTFGRVTSFFCSLALVGNFCPSVGPCGPNRMSVGIKNPLGPPWRGPTRPGRQGPAQAPDLAAEILSDKIVSENGRKFGGAADDCVMVTTMGACVGVGGVSGEGRVVLGLGWTRWNTTEYDHGNEVGMIILSVPIDRVKCEECCVTVTYGYQCPGRARGGGIGSVTKRGCVIKVNIIALRLAFHFLSPVRGLVFSLLVLRTGNDLIGIIGLHNVRHLHGVCWADEPTSRGEKENGKGLAGKCELLVQFSEFSTEWKRGPSAKREKKNGGHNGTIDKLRRGVELLYGAERNAGENHAGRTCGWAPPPSNQIRGRD